VSAPNPLALPALRVNLEDRAAAEVVRVLGMMDAHEQLREMQKLQANYGRRSEEVSLRLAEVLIQNPQLGAEKRSQMIDKTLVDLEDADPFDWRPVWLRGVWLLCQGKGHEAQLAMERCYFEMPGELAPRLGMGLAWELAGQAEQALPYYERVARVDPSMVAAHAGAARCHARAGRIAQALEAMEQFPEQHVLKTEAQLATAELLILHPEATDVSLLRAASNAVESVLERSSHAPSFAGRLCALAVDVAQKLGWPGVEPFLGQPFSEKSLRLNAEHRFRQAAKLAKSEDERLFWVGRANAIRPVTLF